MSGPKLSSNSKLFARRGDPWITNREGVKDYGRNPEAENPEYDFDHRFHHTGETFGKPSVAIPKEELREPKPTPSSKPDYARRKAALLMNMNKRIREVSQPISVRDTSTVRIRCPFFGKETVHKKVCTFSAFDSRKVSAHIREEH